MIATIRTYSWTLVVPMAGWLSCGLLAWTLLAGAEARAARPNFLIVIADDLGFSDLGCYGGEIQTPNLDRLAKEGVRFTQFYNTARCWPTRSSLLTGYYAQQIRRDLLPGVPSGGRGVRPSWAKLLPERLKPLGYRAYHSGKWHIDGMPLAEGFDRSYYLRDQGRFFNPKVHYEDDKRLPPVPKNSGYYGTEAIGDHAIRCLQEHHRDHATQPFFHYLAFTAPHFPLHALPEDIEKYKTTYQDGWQRIRAARWRRMRELKLLEGQELSAVERDLGPPYAFPEQIKQLGEGEVNRPLLWETLTPTQQKFQAAKMAIHAAMIDRVDVVIGKVLDQLDAMEARNNTLIFFLSDNGCSAEIMVRDDGHDPQAPMGSAATYLCLGPGWSTASNTPFRRHKTWTHEGGVSTPLIACWPDGIKDRGALRKQAGHVIDFAPTILELAGGAPPAARGSAPEMPGRSLAKALTKDAPVPRDFLWWFHDGHRAIQQGRWKAVAPKGEPWEMYDLRADRAESNNLAGSQAERAAQLESLWTTTMQTFRKTALTDLPKPTKQPKRPSPKPRERKPQ